MDIIISKEEIIESKKLKVISEITLTKEKTTLFEKKYGCSIDAFRNRMEETDENFKEWDDYIEWKANFELLKDLENRLIELDNAKNIKIV
ncbi:MAG: hypothetical protein V3V33_11760 [Candidatus Lokiarchaeia archaeon]